jgi:hypothetical protein
MNLNKYSEWYIHTCNINNKKINEKFVEWINNVEEKVEIIYGLRLLDLVDENYMYNFEKGISSDKMTDIVLENNKI